MVDEAPPVKEILIRKLTFPWTYQ